MLSLISWCHFSTSWKFGNLASWYFANQSCIVWGIFSINKKINFLVKIHYTLSLIHINSWEFSYINFFLLVSKFTNFWCIIARFPITPKKFSSDWMTIKKNRQQEFQNCQEILKKNAYVFRKINEFISSRKKNGLLFILWKLFFFIVLLSATFGCECMRKASVNDVYSLRTSIATKDISEGLNYYSRLLLIRSQIDIFFLNHFYIF